jgi:hypothetical protein
MEEKILRQIGLSDVEIRAYLKKLYKFFKGLTKAEQAVFLASMGTKEDALRSFKNTVTLPELEEFLRNLEQVGEPIIIIEGVTSRPPKKPQDNA